MAAKILGITERKVRRMVKRVRTEGSGGISRLSRGKKPNNWIPARIKRTWGTLLHVLGQLQIAECTCSFKCVGIKRMQNPL